MTIVTAIYSALGQLPHPATWNRTGTKLNFGGRSSLISGTWKLFRGHNLLELFYWFFPTPPSPHQFPNSFRPIWSLKLATLVQSREFLSLVQLFRFIKGHSSVNTNNYISFSNRQSRKSHQFKLYKPFCRTDIFKYSFWHRHIDTWNSLPSSVVELDSINAFKKALKSTFFN